MSACKSIGPLLDGYHDGELGSLERWRVQRHLTGCGACRHDLASLEQIGGFVRASVAGAGATDLWDAIEARLPAARPAPPPRRALRPRMLWMPGIAAAAAAAVLALWLPIDADRGPSGVVRSVYSPERSVMVLEAEQSDDPTIIWVMDEQGGGAAQEGSPGVGI
jgi:anti-sigma factor RsiW